jgi:chromosome segregation ATPase
MDESVRDRIFAAANELYTENGKIRFPPVADVRKRAKVDTNDACSAMREWRRIQGKKTGTVASAALPQQLQASALNALVSFWQEATNLASESLITAQAAWDAERQENEELCQQIAAECDVQAAELASARQEIIRLNALVQQQASEIEAVRAQVKQACEERDRAQQGCSETTVRFMETKKRAEDLQQAVAYAREDATRARAEADAVRMAHAEQSERIRAEFKQELETERARLIQDRQRYEELATNATTEAGRLRGRLEAMEAIRSAAAPGTATPRRSKRPPDGGAGPAKGA